LLKSVALHPPAKLIIPILTLAPLLAGILYAETIRRGVSKPAASVMCEKSGYDVIDVIYDCALICIIKTSDTKYRRRYLVY